ncbi:MAG: BON domain-containing protein [Stenotrophomonas sp.]|uniref:BON domain-containing protein n=1 Tax=Stenotrophomonas sp. TaxID=69392 RepID=UPI003D6CC58F
MKHLYVRNLLFAAALLPACAPVALASTAHSPAQESGYEKSATTHSEQPGSDTWITTKVKADLLATKDVPGMELKVETVNGVVSLSGHVRTQVEADRAVAVARKIEGVARVDSSGITVGPGANGH